MMSLHEWSCCVANDGLMNTCSQNMYRAICMCTYCVMRTVIPSENGLVADEDIR